MEYNPAIKKKCAFICNMSRPRGHCGKIPRHQGQRKIQKIKFFSGEYLPDDQEKEGLHCKRELNPSTASIDPNEKSKQCLQNSERIFHSQTNYQINQKGK